MKHGLFKSGLCIVFALLLQMLPILPLFSALPAQAEEVKVNYTANKVEYLKPEGLYKLTGAVDLKVRDIQIKTEYLEYDINNKVLRSNTDFEMIQTPKDEKPRTVKGKSFAYNVDLKRIEAQEVYLVIPSPKSDHEIYLQGDFMTAYNDGQRVILQNGFATTCNHYEGKLEDADQDPYSREAVRRRIIHYAIEGEIIDYIKDDRVLAWNVNFLAFDGQIFWFPFWYTSLQSPPGVNKPDIDYGQNNYEGWFVRFKGNYKLNDYHDGRWWTNVMEKKGVGVGIQHDWIAYPNSISRLTFYGIPVTTELLNMPQSLLSVPNLAADLQKAQNLSTQQLNITDPQNPLDWIGRWVSNKFQDHIFKFEHHQKILPHMEAVFNFSDEDMYTQLPGFTADRNPRRAYSLSLEDTERFLLDPYSELEVQTRLNLDQSVNNPKRITIDANNAINESGTINQSQNRKADIRATLGKSNVSINTGWNNSLNQTYQKLVSQGISPSASPSANSSSLPAPGTLPVNNPTPAASSGLTVPRGNENWNSTLNFNTNLDEQTTLTTNLTYISNVNGIGDPANSRLLQTIQPRVSLDQTHDWGSIKTVYEDFLDISPVLDLNNSSGQVKKLPELDLQFKPLFADWFPIQFQSKIGRYLEPASFDSSFSLNEIGRSMFKFSLPSKEYNLGLGNKVNYGGTEFEQRFYQTLDAEYIFRGQVNFYNDFSPYFIPRISYQRGLQDKENNNSPFKNLESLRLSDVNQLTYNLDIGNIPEFKMNINGNYNYIDREYSRIGATINSTFGSNLNFNVSSGYTPANIKDEQVGKEMLDIDRNVYHHLDPLKGPTFTVRPQDVGSFNFYGGRWDPLSIGVRWRSTEQELVLGNLKTFGLESGIPEGVDLGAFASYDFHKGQLSQINFLYRMSFGSSWIWHTELDVVASTQFLNPPQSWTDFIPPVVITLRKDLHDFVLTASWNSFLQQFNFNLQLLAFPDISTDSLLNNVNKLDSQVNTLGQGIN